MTKCDHIFCGDCLNTALKTSLTCPVDRGPLSSETSALDIQREPAEGAPDLSLLRGLRKGGSVMDVPNAILNMVDELRVKCPNNAAGCNVETARCDVQRHVNKDCGYMKVPCPSEACGLKIRRKDLEARCLHEVVTCDACETDMMEVDLKAHRAICPKLSLACPHCAAEILRCHLYNHVSECPEASVTCAGASLGCSYGSKRRQMQAHSSTCPYVIFAPFLKSQNDRMRALEDENKLLKRKIDLLYPPGIMAAQENSDQDVQSPFPNFAANPGTSEPPILDLSGPTHPDLPPFSSPTHHLLSLHESLRTEVDHLAANISDLEAKQSMMLMNESLRTNEELAGIRAAIGAIRMQVQWLLSQRLQSSHQAARPNAVAGPSRGGSSNASTSTARRLSDTTRQDVKL
ncbi:hypothetical protein GP486_005300 [Trichoglossum hirsutum]|uniref:TRAF-type domain-containing protein n=1 Tax=Trichoglossum hirsutum TaxID=265104 RepID=A0A9P8L9H4_9PEZI|nr:hypothetical protein GP486_005300 [Trichoglossum hirsutum]